MQWHRFQAFCSVSYQNRQVSQWTTIRVTRSKRFTFIQASFGKNESDIKNLCRIDYDILIQKFPSISSCPIKHSLKGLHHILFHTINLICWILLVAQLYWLCTYLFWYYLKLGRLGRNWNFVESCRIRRPRMMPSGCTHNNNDKCFIFFR